MSDTKVRAKVILRSYKFWNAEVFNAINSFGGEDEGIDEFNEELYATSQFAEDYYFTNNQGMKLAMLRYLNPKQLVSDPDSSLRLKLTLSDLQPQLDDLFVDISIPDDIEPIQHTDEIDNFSVECIYDLQNVTIHNLDKIQNHPLLLLCEPYRIINYPPKEEDEEENKTYTGYCLEFAPKFFMNLTERELKTKNNFSVNYDSYSNDFYVMCNIDEVKYHTSDKIYVTARWYENQLLDETNEEKIYAPPFDEVIDTLDLQTYNTREYETAGYKTITNKKPNHMNGCNVYGFCVGTKMDCHYLRDKDCSEYGLSGKLLGYILLDKTNSYFTGLPDNLEPTVLALLGEYREDNFKNYALSDKICPTTKTVLICKKVNSEEKVQPVYLEVPEDSTLQDVKKILDEKYNLTTKKITSQLIIPFDHINDYYLERYLIGDKLPSFNTEQITDIDTTELTPEVFESLPIYNVNLIDEDGCWKNIKFLYKVVPKEEIEFVDTEVQTEKIVDENLTLYIDVYSVFLSKITDYYLLDLCDEEIRDRLFTLMNNALVKLRPIEHDWFDKDDELETFNVKLLPIEIEYLASQMVLEWLEPQINNTLLTRQYFGTKDDKFYAQANQLEKLMLLQENTIARTEKIIRNFQYLNTSKIGG